MKNIRMRLRHSLLGLVALAPGTVAAQAVVGSGCTTFAVAFNQQQSVALSHPIHPGELVVVSVAVNAAAEFADINPVTDGASGSYPIVSAGILGGYSGVIAAFARVSTTTLSSGSIVVNYFTTGSTSAQSCVEVMTFPGVAALNRPDDAYGSNYGFGNSLGAATSTATEHASELVYSVFASAATPGTIGSTAPANGLNPLCSPDGTLCLLPAWNLGATRTGTEMARAASTNSNAWGALLVTFQSNDRIFANGFE